MEQESHHGSQSSVELVAYLSQDPEVVMVDTEILVIYKMRDLFASVVIEVRTMSHSFPHP